MATKPQAKTAIDNTVVLIKADIDNILPAGVNISDGSISFSPSRWTIILTVADLPAAETLATGIIANLTLAGKASTLDRRRRGEDQRSFFIVTSNTTYKIIGF